MKQIELNRRNKCANKGYFTLVDDEDFELLNKENWSLIKKSNTFYVSNSTTRIRMHRIIMNAQKGQIIDHIDGNGLNNQKNNLRICTQSENNRNRKGYGKSKFLGVDYQNIPRMVNKWRASIMHNKKRLNIGCFSTEIEAAIAYNIKATELHGEFTKLNKV